MKRIAIIIALLLMATTAYATGAQFSYGSDVCLGCDNTFIGSNVFNTGATFEDTLDMGDNPIVNVEYIDMDLDNGIPCMEGRLTWNDTDGTLNVCLKGGTVNLQSGQEMVVRGKNTVGVGITNGTPIRISGVSGSNPEWGLSNAIDPFTAGAIGIATENISDNQFGYITTFGLVRELNTTGTPVGEVWSDGDRIWVGNTAGELTNVMPTGLERKIFIGIVFNTNANDGIIWVNPINQAYPSELSGPTVAYSEFYAENLMVTITAGAFTNVGGLTNGVSNNITLTNSTGAATAIYNAVYDTVASVSGSDPDSQSELYHYAFKVNGVVQEKCEIHRSIGTLAAEGAIPVTCKLALGAGDVVHLAISSDGGDDFDAEHINWGLTEIR